MAALITEAILSLVNSQLILQEVFIIRLNRLFQKFDLAFVVSHLENEGGLFLVEILDYLVRFVW